jgi:hypothetical protein
MVSVADPEPIKHVALPPVCPLIFALIVLAVLKSIVNPPPLLLYNAVAVNDSTSIATAYPFDSNSSAELLPGVPEYAPPVPSADVFNEMVEILPLDCA